MKDNLRRLLDEYVEKEAQFNYVHNLDPDNAFTLKTRNQMLWFYIIS